MKTALAVVFLAASTLTWAGLPDPASSSEFNVNTRYTVESVGFAPDRSYRLSESILDEMQRLVGERLNVEALNRLSRRLTDELRARKVTFRVSRGLEAAHVRVTFEVEKRNGNFDVSLSTLAYNSHEGWSGNGQASLTFGDNVLTAIGVSNGDDLVERYSGVRARYNRLHVGSDRVRLGFEFDSFHDQFNSATLTAFNRDGSSLGAGAYRSRMNFEPSATFVLAKPVTLTVGASFQEIQPNYVSGPAEAANSLIGNLRYHDHWDASDSGSHDLDAFYRMRAATRALGSDSLYTKHSVQANYLYKHDQQSVEVTVMAGVIYGRAPLFERFVLGNSTILRGWNKFDIQPLGGNRVLYGSVTYGYHIMRVFYDTGSVWDSGKVPEEKHSAGVGVTTGLGLFGKNAVLVAVAFPIRQGHADPVFIAGMSF